MGVISPRAGRSTVAGVHPACLTTPLTTLCRDYRCLDSQAAQTAFPDWMPLSSSPILFCRSGRSAFIMPLSVASWSDFILKSLLAKACRNSLAIRCSYASCRLLFVSECVSNVGFHLWLFHARAWSRLGSRNVARLTPKLPYGAVSLSWSCCAGARKRLACGIFGTQRMVARGRQLKDVLVLALQRES